MTKALEVETLFVSYGKTPALWDINFSIPKGITLAIVGPNGAGKSTLLKAMLGIIPSISGSIRLLGLPLKAAKKKVAYVPQRSSVDWDFPATVRDVVLMGVYGKLGLFKWVTKKERKAADEALDKVGMLKFADRQISELSGGQQQRVFFARALIQEAEIYFMDEPFAGVDMATEKTLIDLLHQIKNEGKTVVVVHHDLATVKAHFDWVMLLNTCLIGCGEVRSELSDENIKRAYGRGAHLLEEAKKLSQNKSSGLK